MDSTAIRLRDPSGEYWAQLVDLALTPAHLVPVFVERLGLPANLNYELVEESADRSLYPDRSLIEADIGAGSTLVIRPVRDSVLIAFLRALYDEAADKAKDELWDIVMERLQTIYRLDPQYPDSQQLWRRVASSGTKASTAAPKPSSVPGTQPSAGPGQAPPISSGQPKRSTPSVPKTTVSSAGRSVFARLFFLLIIVVIGGGILIYAEIIPEPDWLPDWFPRRTAEAATTTINGVEVGTGDVRVTLTWDNAADIDLHVTDPRGEEIYFGNPQSASGGRLDVDANGLCADDPAVENVFWPTGRAPVGTYNVAVERFRSCGAGSTRYEVAVYVDGTLVDRHTGTLTDSQSIATLPSFRR